MRLKLLQTVFAHLADTTEANDRTIEGIKGPIRKVCRGKIQGERTGRWRI